MSRPPCPTLIAVAHGTRSGAGIARIEALAGLVRAARPGVRVELCWLELASPLLRDVVGSLEGPAVVVPLLLSTGYHVKVDIAGIVGNRAQTAVARQLGPDPRITAVVKQRLLQAGWTGGAVAIFASGSSDPEAADNLDVVAAQLGQQLSHPVLARFLTDKRWRDGLPVPITVANYLLAPGFFDDQLQAIGRELGTSCVARPIGAHPAVAAVALDRYEEAARTLTS